MWFVSAALLCQAGARAIACGAVPQNQKDEATFVFFHTQGFLLLPAPVCSLVSEKGLVLQFHQDDLQVHELLHVGKKEASLQVLNQDIQAPSLLESLALTENKENTKTLEFLKVEENISHQTRIRGDSLKVSRETFLSGENWR